jgi:hypothetical protein
MSNELLSRMRPCRSAGFALLLSLAYVASAQTPSVVRRDEKAVQAVTQALSAMGGSAVWSQVASTIVTGSCATPVVHGGVISNFRWTTKGREFRYETDTDRNGPIYLSSHGSPKIATHSGNTNLSYENGLRRLPFYLPGLILTKVLNEDTTRSLLMLGAYPIEGIDAIHIRTIEYQGLTKLQGTQQDWWFNTNNGMPMQVIYVLPTNDNTHYLQYTMHYGAWNKEGSIVVPFQLSIMLNGQFLIQSCTVQTVETNRNLSSAIFHAR